MRRKALWNGTDLEFDFDCYADLGRASYNKYDNECAFFYDNELFYLMARSNEISVYSHGARADKFINDVLEHFKNEEDIEIEAEMMSGDYYILRTWWREDSE